MLVTLPGIVSDVKPVQLAKAEDSMLVTLPGISTEDRPVQPEKAPLPILFKLPGREIDVILLQ